MADRISWSNFPTLRDFDRFDFRESNGTAGQITFAFSTGSNITWWKALKLLNRSTGEIIREVQLEGNAHGPLSLTVAGSEIDSTKITLAKAKIFGIHTDMYEIHELREKVGLNISLTWRTDGPDNIWTAIGSFFSDIASGFVRGVMTVVNAVITVVETVVNAITNALSWVVGLILAIPIVGRAIAWLSNAVWTGVGWIVNTVMEGAAAVGGIVGIRQPEKLIRLQIVVQRDAFNKPVASPDEVAAQLDFLIWLFQVRANVRVVPARPFTITSMFNAASAPLRHYVTVLDRPSHPSTLDVRCGAGGFADDFGTAGANFQVLMNNLYWGNTRRLLGYGAPLVVFAVRSFTDGNVGCSFGPASNYITVQFAPSANGTVVPQYSTLAHEVGHACALFHADGNTNLMVAPSPSPVPPGDPLDWLTNEQAFAIRVARWSSFF